MTKKELTQKKISAISLGCDKNKVDLEKMLGRVKDYGFSVVGDVYDADIVIVNTCAFIQPAQEEAIQNILEMIALKERAVIEKIIVSGCLPERHFDDLPNNFPEVDLFLRVRENNLICQKIEELYGVEKTKPAKEDSRVLTCGASYAYLKIADGCDNFCSYCTIPRIRGRYKSLPMDELIDEAKELVKMGIKELILVAQDTTRYGEDLYGENKLIELCQKLCKIKELKWIRLHYLYPEKVSPELLDFIDKNEKMCKYLDIPLQHIDNQLLKSMKRRVSEEDTYKLIDFIKTKYPNFALRSTFIVGYPAENGAKFKKLLKFIKWAQLDYAGFFPYSKEPNTASFFMDKQVSLLIKKYRTNKIRKLQQKIVESKILNLLGHEMQVLVDYFDENTGEFVAHSQKLSPTVDFGVRFVDNGNVEISSFVKVKIYDFDGSYLKGEIL